MHTRAVLVGVVAGAVMVAAALFAAGWVSQASCPLPGGVRYASRWSVINNSTIALLHTLLTLCVARIGDCEN
jgi:hypothetical protein